MALACKAGEFCCAIDMDSQLTEIWVSQKMIPRKRVTRCLLFLHIPLGRTLKKKNKTKKKPKKPVLHAGYIPCTSEYNHKIPFQCFISINSNTDPNFTTTFVKGCFKCQKQFFLSNFNKR